MSRSYSFRMFIADKYFDGDMEQILLMALFPERCLQIDLKAERVIYQKMKELNHPIFSRSIL